MLPLIAVIIAGLGLVVNVGVTVVLWRMTQSIRRFERMEDSSGEALAAAEAKLHEMTTKLIDERFRGMTHDVRGHINPLVAIIDEMRGRLKESEDGLGQLGDRDQKIELAVAAKFDQVKDWIREMTASKEDFRSYESSNGKRLDALVGQVHAIGEKVAVVFDRLERKGGPGSGR